MKRTSRLARARPAQAVRVQAAATEAVLQIERLGARGDGVAAGETGPIFAPFTLPGESVRALVQGDRAQVLEVLAPAAERATPSCAAFGVCGGCQLQHWDDAPALAWKARQVEEALLRRGVTKAVDSLRPAWGEGRRRAALHASRVGGALRFGFIERGGAAIAAIEACPALAPGLAEALGSLRAVALRVAPARGECVLHCLATETGVDCDVRGGVRPAADGLETLARAAGGLARLSLDGEPFVMTRKPELRMGAARVFPPPGAFTQATTAGEEALADEVLAAARGARRVVDLFCGVGTFALRLGQTADEVRAFDGDEAALLALRAAADLAQLRGIEARRRDLLRTPLSALEMKKADLVVFDPPRSGARLQAAEIAQSPTPRAVAVSCDAGTFARDARALTDGGFALTRLAVIDQFRWTGHVEIVGVFER